MYLDALFNLHKVKFTKLDKLFSDAEIKTVIQTVNIFINVESMFSMIHNKLIEEKLTVADRDELSRYFSNIISNVINVASHYRLFFTKNKIRSNIVFYYNPTATYSKYNNIMYNKEYRSKYVTDYSINPTFEVVNGLIHEAVKMINNIVYYIDSVYFIESDRVESSVIPLVLVNEKKLDGQLNILVTKDLYDLQYVNKNFLIVYPHKEDSKLITKSNLFNIVKEREECDIEFNLPPYLYSFILSVIGDKRRSISKVKGVGFNTIYKNMTKLFKALDIGEDEYISFEQLASSIKEDPVYPNRNKDRVINNYMSIDIDRQFNVISETQKVSLYEQMIDKFDMESLKRINDKYFDFSPIHILELNNYYKKKGNLF